MLRRILVTTLVGLIASIAPPGDAAADTFLYRAPEHYTVVVRAVYGDAVALTGSSNSLRDGVVVRGQSVIGLPGYTVQDIAPDSRGVASVFLTRKHIAYRIDLDAFAANVVPGPMLVLDRRHSSFEQFTAWGGRYAFTATTRKGYKDSRGTVYTGRWGRPPTRLPAAKPFTDPGIAFDVKQLDLRQGRLLSTVGSDSSPHAAYLTNLSLYQLKPPSKPCTIIGLAHDQQDEVIKPPLKGSEITQAQFESSDIVWSRLFADGVSPARTSLGRTAASCRRPHRQIWSNGFPGTSFGLSERSFFYTSFDLAERTVLYRASSLPVFSARAP